MISFTGSSAAYAKINLVLRIVGRRSDGYHLLSTVMQSVSLHDDVTVSIDFSERSEHAKPAVSLEQDDRDLPSDEKNTMFRAASEFLREIRLPRARVFISAKKRIPKMAGLGGGSSDAAAVLRLLNEGFSRPFDRSKLGSIAMKIGADVPFFLDGGAALCEGIGEIITQIPSFGGLPVLIIKPEQGISTPQAYATYDRESKHFSIGVRDNPELTSLFFSDFPEPSERLIRTTPFLSNDLQGAAIEAVPILFRILEAFRESGCIYSAVTGSGSAVFALYSDPVRRDCARKDIGTRFGNGFFVFSGETKE